MLSHTVFVCMCSHTYVFSYTGPIIYKALAGGVDLLCSSEVLSARARETILKWKRESLLTSQISVRSHTRFNIYPSSCDLLTSCGHGGLLSLESGLLAGRHMYRFCHFLGYGPSPGKQSGQRSKHTHTHTHTHIKNKHCG